jgi:hypothetical protein
MVWDKSMAWHLIAYAEKETGRMVLVLRGSVMPGSGDPGVRRYGLKTLPGRLSSHPDQIDGKP